MNDISSAEVCPVILPTERLKSLEGCDELEAIVDRHAPTIASYDLELTVTGHPAIVDRDKAVARFKETLDEFDETGL
jgi:hypothetical protein